MGIISTRKGSLVNYQTNNRQRFETQCWQDRVHCTEEQKRPQKFVYTMYVCIYVYMYGYNYESTNYIILFQFVLRIHENS